MRLRAGLVLAVLVVAAVGRASGAQSSSEAWRTQRLAAAGGTPAFALLSSGAAVAAWTERPNNTTVNIVSAVRSAAGSAWRRVVLATVPEHPAYDDYYDTPALAAPVGDHFLVAWVVQSGGRPVLQGTLFNSRGDRGPTLLLSKPGAAVDFPLRLVPLQNGALAILYNMLPMHVGGRGGPPALCWLVGPCRMTLTARLMSRTGVLGAPHSLMSVSPPVGDRLGMDALQAVPGRGGSLLVSFSSVSLSDTQRYKVRGLATTGRWSPYTLTVGSTSQLALATAGDGTFLVASEAASSTLTLHEQLLGHDWRRGFVVPDANAAPYVLSATSGSATAVLSWCQHAVSSGQFTGSWAVFRVGSSQWSTPVSLGNACVQGIAPLKSGENATWWLNGNGGQTVTVGVLDSTGLSHAAALGHGDPGDFEKFSGSPDQPVLLVKRNMGYSSSPKLEVVTFAGAGAHIAKASCCSGFLYYFDAVAAGSHILAGYGIPPHSAVAVALGP